jgi:ribosomal protein L44E
MFAGGKRLCNSEAGHGRPFMVASARVTKKMTLREKCESLREAERSPLAEAGF